MAEKRGFVQGAMVLAAAAAISKLLGSVYTIVLQNVIGDHGMGLFQMAYPIYATLLAVATAGFPVAISKLVAERLALGDVLGSRKIFHVSAALLTLLGIACFAVLFFGADVWASNCRRSRRCLCAASHRAGPVVRTHGERTPGLLPGLPVDDTDRCVSGD